MYMLHFRTLPAGERRGIMESEHDKAWHFDVKWHRCDRPGRSL